MVSPVNGYGSILLLSVARQIALGNRTPYLLILGETMNWVNDTAVYPDDNIPLRGCPILLQVISICQTSTHTFSNFILTLFFLQIWAYEKLGLVAPVLDDQ